MLIFPDKQSSGYSVNLSNTIEVLNDWSGKMVELILQVKVRVTLSLLIIGGLEPGFYNVNIILKVYTISYYAGREENLTLQVPLKHYGEMAKSVDGEEVPSLIVFC